MPIWQQKPIYQALQARLAALDLDLMIGVPRALQRLPTAYLASDEIEVPPGKFSGVRFKPTLTLGVALQENAAAELQLVDLVDLVATDLMGDSLTGACRCAVERVDYETRPLGGIDYRFADLTLVLVSL